MALSGQTATTQAGTVYLKKAATFDPFEWGGRWMRLDESTDNRGSLSASTRQNPRGGVERDRLNQDVPGTVDFSIVMKQRIGDRRKTELLRCFWIVDRRTHCEGRDRDDPNAWLEITRKCFGRASGRTTPATSWDGEEDALVTVPMQALNEYDIYQVEYSETLAISANAVSITDIDVCHPEKCPTCDPEDDCVVAAVTTLEAAASPILLLNTEGGDLDQWTQIVLSDWTVGDADAILCLGNFLVIVSNGEGAVLRSDNRGTTVVETSNADMAANAPNQIDGIDQTYILMCGDNGYIYGSFDGARTWETLDAGIATTENLARIMIARDNPLVAYAIGANNALVKTGNGGLTWVALTGPSAADGLLGLWVEDEDHVLIVNDDGELWETSDASVSWTQQSALPEVTATLTDADIVRVDCDVYYMVVSDGTDSTMYRNVQGGADGYWLKIDPATNPVSPFTAVTACDGNRAIAVGGNGTIVNMAAVIA